MKSSKVSSAYEYCRKMAGNHYENFPVASRLLPGELRDPISAIYAFARTADDLADEGDESPVVRLARLDEYEQSLRDTADGHVVDDPVFIALADSMQRFDLPPALFLDLVSAFRQDVTKTRYENFGEILDYCRRSANPVGQLLLHMLGKYNEKNRQYSDNICTALQLVNFYQDIEQDYEENNRIYLPLDEMEASGINEVSIRHRDPGDKMRSFMHTQYRRARDMLCAGLPLCRKLGSRMNLEILATINGGLRVLELLENAENIYIRPRLGKKDILVILLRTTFRLNNCSHYGKHE